MNIQRITVSLPKYIHEELLAVVNKQQLSRFVTQAVEDRLLEEKTSLNDPIAKFFNLRQKLPKITDKEIFDAKNKGRT